VSIIAKSVHHEGHEGHEEIFGKYAIKRNGFPSCSSCPSWWTLFALVLDGIIASTEAVDVALTLAGLDAVLLRL